MLVAVTRSGWLALFMGDLMIGDPTIIPILAVVVLPAWLIVTGRPEMVISPRRRRASLARLTATAGPQSGDGLRDARARRWRRRPAPGCGRRCRPSA